MGDGVTTAPASRESLLSHIRTRPLQTVKVMAFGSLLTVKELDAKRRDAVDTLLAKLQKERGDDEASQLVTACWIIGSVVDDATGAQVFKAEDVDEVANGPSKDTRRLWKQIAKLNGLGDEDEGDGGN